MREIFGGHWDDIDKSRIKRWPNDSGDLRPIHIERVDWAYSLGGKHFEITVHEHYQQYWSSKHNAWVEVGSDGSKRGFELQVSCLEEEDAYKTVVAFLNLVSSPKTHNLSVNKCEISTLKKYGLWSLKKRR